MRKHSFISAYDSFKVAAVVSNSLQARCSATRMVVRHSLEARCSATRILRTDSARWARAGGLKSPSLQFMMHQVNLAKDLDP